MRKSPQKATEEDKRARKRKKKTKQTITRAVTHIRLIEANAGKLDALDQLATTLQALCQQYVTSFCRAASPPDGYADPSVPTELSERYQRVAIQQAAGIAKSWRTNRQAAYDAYLEELLEWKQAQEQNPDPTCQEPTSPRVAQRDKTKQASKKGTKE